MPAAACGATAAHAGFIPPRIRFRELQMIGFGQLLDKCFVACALTLRGHTRTHGTIFFFERSTAPVIIALLGLV